MPNASIEHISAVRTAATWMRKKALPLERYPRYAQLSSTQRQEAQHFAVGILPWPSKWTIRLYEVATAG
jgi:hypothetical protein